jgi:hypothetical protein
MNWMTFWFFLTLTPTLAGGTVVRAFADDLRAAQARTWKTVDELSPQELRAVDLSPHTPRYDQVPYLPAEPYPFTAPYTAEEMGYRAMEFTQ